MTSSRRAPGAHFAVRAGLAALAFFTLGASSCFGPPVVERLRFEFLASGEASATVAVELAEGEVRNPRVARRLAEWRRDLQNGDDPWSRRLAELRPREEVLTYLKRDGVLVGSERRATVADPQELGALFADSPIFFSWSQRGTERELVLTPGRGGASRAGRAERQELERRSGPWLEAAVRYLDAIDTLYRSCGPAGEGGRLCFAKLFDDDAAGAAELTAAEQATVDEADAATSTLIDALSVPDDESHSLEELSRLVFDPFPAPLELRVHGVIDEVEGFARGPQGELTVPALTHFGALLRLAERWPALAIFAPALTAEPEQSEEIDLAAFVAALAASAPAPNESELRAAFARELQPAARYRVVWHSPLPTQSLPR